MSSGPRPQPMRQDLGEPSSIVVPLTASPAPETVALLQTTRKRKSESELEGLEAKRTSPDMFKAPYPPVRKRGTSFSEGVPAPSVREMQVRSAPPQPRRPVPTRASLLSRLRELESQTLRSPQGGQQAIPPQLVPGRPRRDSAGVGPRYGHLRHLAATLRSIDLDAANIITTTTTTTTGKAAARAATSTAAGSSGGASLAPAPARSATTRSKGDGSGRAAVSANAGSAPPVTATSAAPAKAGTTGSSAPPRANPAVPLPDTKPAKAMGGTGPLPTTAAVGSVRERASPAVSLPGPGATKAMGGIPTTAAVGSVRERASPAVPLPGPSATKAMGGIPTTAAVGSVRESVPVSAVAAGGDVVGVCDMDVSGGEEEGKGKKAVPPRALGKMPSQVAAASTPPPTAAKAAPPPRPAPAQMPQLAQAQGASLPLTPQGQPHQQASGVAPTRGGAPAPVAVASAAAPKQSAATVSSATTTPHAQQPARGPAPAPTTAATPVAVQEGPTVASSSPAATPAPPSQPSPAPGKERQFAPVRVMPTPLPEKLKVDLADIDEFLKPDPSPMPAPPPKVTAPPPKVTAPPPKATTVAKPAQPVAAKAGGGNGDGDSDGAQSGKLGGQDVPKGAFALFRGRALKTATRELKRFSGVCFHLSKFGTGFGEHELYIQSRTLLDTSLRFNSMCCLCVRMHSHLLMRCPYASPVSVLHSLIRLRLFLSGTSAGARPGPDRVCVGARTERWRAGDVQGGRQRFRHQGRGPGQPVRLYTVCCERGFRCALIFWVSSLHATSCV